MAIMMRFSLCLPGRLAARLFACLCLVAISAFSRVVIAEELPATDVYQSQSGDVRSAQEVSESSESSASIRQEQAGEGTAETDEVRQSGEAAAKPVPAQTGTIMASVRLEGPKGVLATIEGLTLPKQATAWDATKLALAQSGLSYRLGTDSAHDVIASVDDPDGNAALGFDSDTGNGWHLYLNAERYQGSASTAGLRDGDEVVWRYEVPSFEVTVAVVGPGGTGTEYWVVPTAVSVSANQNAWDASYAVFEQNGFAVGRLISYYVGQDGAVRLESLSGLGENGITGESWQVFVNGAPASTDAAHVVLHAGDSVCWYYVGNGVSVLPVFAEETGAASPSPVVGVRVDGRVAQAWTASVARRGLIPDALGFGSGIVVSGGGLPAVSMHDVSDVPLAIQTNTAAAWRRSMANMLEKRLYTGRGGRATLARDGSLYYVDGLGSLVKLEVRPEK